MLYSIIAISTYIASVSAGGQIIHFTGGRCDGVGSAPTEAEQCVPMIGSHSFKVINKPADKSYFSIWSGGDCAGNENGYKNIEENACYNIDTGDRAAAMKLYGSCHVGGLKKCADISSHKVTKRDESGDDITVQLVDDGSRPTIYLPGWSSGTLDDYLNTVIGDVEVEYVDSKTGSRHGGLLNKETVRGLM